MTIVSIQNDDDLSLYLSESEQSLLGLERLLVQAESAGALSAGETAEAFRLAHTLKGSSTMMGYSALERSSHLLEDVLAALRGRGSVALTGDGKILIEAVFSYSDYFMGQLERIRAGQKPESSPELDGRLRELAAAVGVKKKEVQAEYVPPTAEQVKIPEGSLRVRVKLKPCPMPHIRCGIIIKAVSRLCSSLASLPAEPQLHPEAAEYLTKTGLELYAIPKDGVTISRIIEKLSAQAFVDSAGELKKEDSKNGSMVHVPQSHIDRLITVFDDLIVAQLALKDALSASGKLDSRIEYLLNQLRRDSLQARDLSSEMGMVEIGAVFSQMRRLVRGMAREYGRDIAVKTAGEHILVDSGMIEGISETLLHIVRNAADHGIEPAEERRAAGKPAEGLITLSAKKENGLVKLAAADDGRGIDRAAVLEKAAAAGLIPKTVKSCSDSELFNILAASGFSTSASVTKYSGRGVGLNAAAQRIRDLHGSVSIESEKGMGTVFTIRIPVTLSVIDTLQVKIDGNRALLPASAVAAVAFASRAAEEDGAVRFQGKAYKRLRTGGVRSDSAGDAYVFLTQDYGNYCLRAQSAGAVGETLLKPLPQYVSDALGGKNIFSGCSMDKSGAILCVLDVYKLISVNEIKLERAMRHDEGV